MVRSKLKGTQARYAFLFLMPGLLILVFVYLIPIVSVIGISLSQGTGDSQTFAGFGNYQIVLNDKLFRSAFLNNFRLLFIVPILTLGSLIFASILYDRIRGWRIYQTVIFIPVVLAVAAMGITFGQLLQFNGLINEFLRSIRLDFLTRDWLGNQNYALWTVGGVIIWKELGFGSILFLARLMSVEQDLYDAAKVDGASWWQRLWNVSVPQLVHVIEFYAILMVVTVFSFVFDYILILTNGGPNNSTIVGEFFIYKFGFIYNRLNIASTVAVLYLLVGLTLMVVRYQIVKRIEE